MMKADVLAARLPEGETDERLTARIDAAVERALADERVVGAVIVVARDGRVIHRRAYGLADREAGTPMRVDHVFRLASVTKPIVSAAAMALVERGALALDEPVTNWLPDFRPRLADGRAPTITLRQLITHTAGLTYGFFQPSDGPYHRAGVSDGLDQPGLAMDEELRRIASAPLVDEPGRSWGYSVALDVLGEVIARAGRASLPEMVERLVTGPLGMRDTGFGAPEPARLVTPYADGNPRPVRMGDPHVVMFGGASGIRFSPSRVFDARSFPSGGSGMVGTADEIALFLETIRAGGGSILKPETARAMMENQIGAMRINLRPVPAWGFGFGGAVLMDPALAGSPLSAGTWQWGGVYGHQWFVDPVRRLTTVALTNTAVEGMAGKFVADTIEAICNDR
ncbi:MAG: beta-lactamase family protein [Variibacter sp.]|nr:beta-lactamase family protein [Variibacter sp.]